MNGYANSCRTIFQAFKLPIFQLASILLGTGRARRELDAMQAKS